MRVGRSGQRARTEGELPGTLVGGVAHRAAPASPRGRWAAAAGSSRSTGSPTRSGPSAAVIEDVDELAGHEVGRQAHHPVDLGSLVHGPAPPGRVHEHAPHLADHFVTAVGGDGVLELGALAQPVEGELGRDLVRAGRRHGSPPRREREETGPVQAGLGQELEEQVVIALGLARVAQDERGPEGRRGLGGADVGDAPQEALAVAPAPHAARGEVGRRAGGRGRSRARPYARTAEISSSVSPEG